MSDTDKLRELTPEDNLKIENDLLKAKLKSEFGMQDIHSKLGAKIENEWLNYLYDFEKMYKENKQVKVYDFIGKPEYKKAETLSDSEISNELDRIFELLMSNNIAVDFHCEYNDKLIYNFITEELFEELVDDMRIEGMRQCFIYEEFHPNHDYDIRYLAKNFFEFFLKSEWNEMNADFHLSEILEYKGEKIERKEFIKILNSFRESFKPVELEKLQIEFTEFDINLKTGSVNGLITYSSHINPDLIISNYGEFELGVAFNDIYWGINEVKFAGFV